MKNFIIYDATGRILRLGNVPEEYLSLQPQAGEFLMLGNADPDTQMVNLETLELVNVLNSPPTDEELLEQLRTYKAEQIDLACRAAILSGYESNALGQSHHYPSKTTDQANMIGSVTDSYNPENLPTWSTPFWCANQAGQWEFRLHDATQIRRAGAAGKAYIAACQLQNSQLQAMIQAAETFQDLEKIAWTTD
jgi:hypothetical protein